MTKGTVNIHGKEYETVASRVSRFRSDHADFGLTTEIIECNEATVIMKATINDAEGHVIATGHAEEDRNSSTINRTSALENCETSAIGRALAAFGLAGTEFASADEVAGVIKQQNTSAPRQAEYGKQGSSKPATEKQKLLIAKILKDRGVVTEDMKAWLSGNYGINGELFIDDAKMVIDDLLRGSK